MVDINDIQHNYDEITKTYISRQRSPIKRDTSNEIFLSEEMSFGSNQKNQIENLKENKENYLLKQEISSNLVSPTTGKQSKQVCE